MHHCLKGILNLQRIIILLMSQSNLGLQMNAEKKEIYFIGI